MNRQSQIYAYPIPAKYFPGYRVIKPFIARVIYTVKGTQVIIEDVGFSEKCLVYMCSNPSLIIDIREKIEAAVAKRQMAFNNNNVHSGTMNAMAPQT